MKRLERAAYRRAQRKLLPHLFRAGRGMRSVLRGLRSARRELVDSTFRGRSAMKRPVVNIRGDCGYRAIARELCGGSSLDADALAAAIMMLRFFAVRHLSYAVGRRSFATLVDQAAADNYNRVVFFRAGLDAPSMLVLAQAFDINIHVVTRATEPHGHAFGQAVFLSQRVAVRGSVGYPCGIRLYLDLDRHHFLTPGDTSVWVPTQATPREHCVGGMEDDRGDGDYDPRHPDGSRPRARPRLIHGPLHWRSDNALSLATFLNILVSIFSTRRLLPLVSGIAS